MSAMSERVISIKLHLGVHHHAVRFRLDAGGMAWDEFLVKARAKLGLPPSIAASAIKVVDDDGVRVVDTAAIFKAPCNRGWNRSYPAWIDSATANRLRAIPNLVERAERRELRCA